MAEGRGEVPCWRHIPSPRRPIREIRIVRGSTQRHTGVQKSRFSFARSSPGMAASIPAWMFNIAWDYLRARGELSNKTLLNDLRVMRSSAVCAILACVSGVERVPGKVAIRRMTASR